MLFNEGYTSTIDNTAQRPDLCREAIRLARALAAHAATAHPDADALAALLLLQGAWLGARVDAQGDWRLLEDRDRGQWDATMIAAGLANLQRAQRAEHLSAWHLRAGIASEYVTAPHFHATRWDEIVAFYDLLLQLGATPATRLAHAVALAHVDGPAAALARIDPLIAALPAPMQSYGHAARGEMLRRQGQFLAAHDALTCAIAAADSPATRRLLMRKRDACVAPTA